LSACQVVQTTHMLPVHREMISNAWISDELG